MRHIGPAGKDQIGAGRVDGLLQTRVQPRRIRPEFEHVAEHRDAARIFVRGTAPSTASAARIDAGIGIVALVDQQDLAAGA